MPFFFGAPVIPLQLQQICAGAWGSSFIKNVAGMARLLGMDGRSIITFNFAGENREPREREKERESGSLRYDSTHLTMLSVSLSAALLFAVFGFCDLAISVCVWRERV